MYTVYVVYKGRITLSDDYSKSSEWLYRDKKPVQFWFSVFVIVALAVLMFFNVFHL